MALVRTIYCNKDPLIDAFVSDGTKLMEVKYKVQ